MRKIRFTSKKKDYPNKARVIADIIYCVCVSGSIWGAYYLLKNKIDDAKEYLEELIRR